MQVLYQSHHIPGERERERERESGEKDDINSYIHKVVKHSLSMYTQTNISRNMKLGLNIFTTNIPDLPVYPIARQT